MKTKRAGMTLVELVAAVAVLAIVTTELLVLRSRAMQVAEEAQLTRTSKELARLKMEEYLSYMNYISSLEEGQMATMQRPADDEEFEDHPGFHWKFEEETVNVDELLPQESETQSDTGTAQEEEEQTRYMVQVTLKIYRLEKEDAEPRVLITLSTLREETPDEKTLNVK